MGKGRRDEHHLSLESQRTSQHGTEAQRHAIEHNYHTTPPPHTHHYRHHQKNRVLGEYDIP
jgi:hypothetical protein